jgi:hypothetical protein
VVPEDVVHVEFSKWGGLPHWHLDMRRLGSDEHGTWLGAGRGSRMSRPGTVVNFTYASVAVVADGQPWLAFFNEPDSGARVSVYVDITTPAVWDGDVLGVVDLDLDVVRTWTGDVKVLDEDEFAEHQVSLAYPAEVIELARQSCAGVLAAVQAGDEPYGQRGAGWLSRFTEGP